MIVGITSCNSYFALQKYGSGLWESQAVFTRLSCIQELAFLQPTDLEFIL